jgi:hypothetical protein
LYYGANGLILRLIYASIFVDCLSAVVGRLHAVVGRLTNNHRLQNVLFPTQYHLAIVGRLTNNKFFEHKVLLPSQKLHEKQLSQVMC